MGLVYTYEKVKYFIEIESNSGCKLLSKEYIDAHHKIHIQCSCGNIFKTSWNAFKSRNKRQCNICGRKKTRELLKYSYEDVKNYIEGENGNGCKLLNKEYINCKEKLQLLCKCGNEFKTNFSEFKHGNKRQCNKCGLQNRINKTRKTQEQFLKEIEKLVGNEYSVLGSYINDSTKILIKHNKCGHEWSVVPSSFLQGTRCPICMHQSYIKTSEEFKREVWDLVGDEYTVLGDYKGCEVKILMCHNNCGHKYNVVPRNFLIGRRCPNCSLPNNPNTEKHIAKLLESLNIKYKKQKTFSDCKNPKTGKSLRFDFGIYDKHDSLFCLLEYDGMQHFKAIDYFGGNEALNDTKYRDNVKNNYCKQNNIKLIRIPYWDFSNLEEVLQQELSEVINDGE